MKFLRSHYEIKDTLCFDFPLIEVEKVFFLELFHGPTMAFKDVGARFMSRCLGYFNKDIKDSKNTVLVATGRYRRRCCKRFLGVKGVEVIILYPSGKVSDIQERQLTTLGQKHLKWMAFFDDCQDTKIFRRKFKTQNPRQILINIARWLFQMFYFSLLGLKKENKKLIFSCPSGNFGNICAGIIAKKMGLPIEHFVAATNVNDTVPRF
jgi:threonine synthase